MSTPTFPSKAFKRRITIRARTAWRAYYRIAATRVESPTAYVATSCLSLGFAVLFLWNLLAGTDHFWSNITSVLAFGWTSLLIGILAVTQVKLVNKTLGLPVVGVFLIGASAYLYERARSSSIQILNRHFPFSVSQLTEAIDSSTLIIFSIEIAAFMPIVVLAWYALLAVQSSASVPSKRSAGTSWFTLASTGAVCSLLFIAAACMSASNSFGLDVMMVRAAYERDFTSNFQCDSVPEGARVLLSKMSDNVGYAVKLTFPDRPFFRMKETDDDLKQAMPLSTHSYRVVNCNKPYAESPSP
ncbi:hypothetical protein [Burkholderia diffusa]|uniref:hypothetical protein n=1 Tax=Burkholderia diffusa TaxID=488732 RepID=UPI002ABD992A|nr:hypothetical protein [Burkholderia diffusa]